MPNREDINDQLVDLLPLLLTGRRLSRQPFCIVHTAYSYTRDYLGALAGLGLALPFATVMSQKPNKDLWSEVVAMPASYRIFAICSVMLATFLKVYITNAGLERRSLLAKQCEQEMRGFYSELEEVLREDDPIPALIKIRNNASVLKKKNVNENSWTYEGGFAPGTDSQALAEATRLCDKYQRRWKP